MILFSLLASACTGSPQEPSAWEESADLAVGAAITGVGTAQVVIDAEAQGSLTHAYGVGALTDALEAAGGEVATFAASQPPDELHADHAEVLAVLHDALTLLAEVRVAYAAPSLSADEERKLRERIGEELDALDELSASLAERVKP